MSIEAELRAEFDRWERTEEKVLRVVPYVLLAVCTVIALVVPSDHLSLTLGLSAATAVWLAGSRRWPSLSYAGLLVLAAALVSAAPWYGLFAFVGYPQAFHLLKGQWRYAGAAATSMIMAVSYLGGIGTVRGGLWPAWLGISVISTVLAWGSSFLIEMADRRSLQQKQALAELHEANVKIEAALEENASLHARLLVQAREAGVLDERQRMAREIHDTLAQGLAGILTQLQAAQQAMDSPPPALSRHMTNAVTLARESLVEARRTVHAVEPEVLAEATLPDAIGEVARRWSEVYGVPAALTTTGDARPMRAEVEVTLLRVAQEALANVAKHASAGRLAVESEPGEGTAISVSVPAIPAPRDAFG